MDVPSTTTTAVQTSLRAAAHAFGDMPNARTPPHSVSQLLHYLQSAELQASEKPLPPMRIMLALAEQTTSELEARSRKAVMQQRCWLQERLQHGLVVADAPGWMRLPKGLRTILCARYSGHTEERYFDNQPPARAAAGPDALAAVGAAHAQLKSRYALWRRVLDSSFGSRCSPREIREIQSTPRAQDSHTPSTRDVDTGGSRDIVEESDDGMVLPVTSSVSIELRGGPSGIISPLVDARTHWQVKVRLDCGSVPCRVSRLILSEDVRDAWAVDLAAEAFGPAELAALERLATVEHSFSPPAELLGSCSSVHVRLKMPRVRASGSLEKEPPKLRVERVL